MSKLSSVFLGTPDFALPSLIATHQASELFAVISQPDRPRGRGQKLSPCPVKEWAMDHGIRVFSPASLKRPSAELKELQEFWTARRPDLLVVTAYGNLLPQEVLDIPKLGCLNVHASLLPRWRGAAPIQRSLEAGDTETGVCLQKVVLELDAGDVLAEIKLSVPVSQDAAWLTHELSQLGGTLLSQYLPTLGQKRRLEGKAQDPLQVTYAHKIKKEEGNWSPSWDSRTFHNKVRAFSLWPRVSCGISGFPNQVFKILATQFLEAKEIPEFQKISDALRPLPAGSLLISHKAVFVKCEGLATGSTKESSGFLLSLEKVQPANKGPVEAHSFFQSAQNQEARKARQEPFMILEPPQI